MQAAVSAAAEQQASGAEVARSQQPARQETDRERDERRCHALATKDAALTLALLHQRD